MVKFFEGLPLFPSRCVLTLRGSALDYCALAQGHAGPGYLHLASGWKGGDLPGSVYQDPFEIMDAAPLALNWLDPHRGRLEKLILAGCRIGVRDGDGVAKNGRVFAYTLCELFRTTVVAATDNVGPENYDDQGEYLPKEFDGRPDLLPVTWKWQGDSLPPTYHDPNTKEFRLTPSPGAKVKTFRISHIQSRLRVPGNASVATDIQLQAGSLANADPRLHTVWAELLLTIDQFPGKTIEMFNNCRGFRVDGEVYVVTDYPEAAKRIARALGYR